MTKTTSRRAILAGAAALPALAAPALASALAAVSSASPLIPMLRSYEAAIVAVNNWTGPDDEDGDDKMHIALFDLVEHNPPAATAQDALAALDFALADEMFDQRFACHQLVWQMIRAARDYIAATESAVQS
jgi:hypothetical protein